MCTCVPTTCSLYEMSEISILFVCKRFLADSCDYYFFLFCHIKSTFNLTVLNKIVAVSQHSNYFYNLSEKIRLDISCKFSARQVIHIKCQALFSLKNTKQVQSLSVAVMIML